MSVALCAALVAALLSQTQPPTSPVEGAPSETKAGAAGPTFEERLERVDREMAAVRDLRADFEQRRRTSLLKKPLVSKGRLVSKGGTVLWKTIEPRKTSMLVTEKQVKIFYPDDNLVEIYPMDAKFREAAGGPLPRLAALRERFEMVPLDPKELTESPADGVFLALQLVPKAEDLKRYVTSIRVLIDERVPCADRVIIASPDGDETEIRFSRVKINAGVEDTEVDLRLPDDVRVSEPIPAAPAVKDSPTVPPGPDDEKPKTPKSPG